MYLYNIRLLTGKIKSFKLLLNVLLAFRKPTDNIVVICSQQLDTYIVEYQRFKKQKNNIA